MTNTLEKVLHRVLWTQDELNKVVNPEWVTSGNNWLRAVWTEAGEAMDYLPWPWWKSVRSSLFVNEKQKQQFYLELADIFCFGISHYLSSMALAEHYRGMSSPTVTDYVVLRTGEQLVASHAAAQSNVEDNPTAVWAVEGIAAAALGIHPTFAASRLFIAATVTELGFGGLLAYYYGKNELNHFRQNHGYKEGKYRKNWGTTAAPEEDNMALAAIIESYRLAYTADELVTHIESGHFANHVRTNLSMTFNNLPPLA